jgi:tol-pal system protein YbgF
MHIRATAGAIVMAVGLAGCVTTPPSEDPVLIKLTEIDQRLQKVERLTNNDSLVELASQLEEARREIRDLRGEVETLAHETQGASTRQRDQYVDIDRRLQSLESRGAVARAPASAGGAVSSSTAGAAAGAAAASKPAAAAASDRARYQQAFDLLKDARYTEARKEFELFMADHPTSDLAGHSQYWLGETYYVTQQFEQALPEFQKVLESYPDSRKLPDAMLKVGYCHYELGQYQQASAQLSRVVQQYPESTAARLAAQRLDRMKSEGR